VHDIVAREFPLLAMAASWTGGIANQNRGRSRQHRERFSCSRFPARVLVYDAELTLISVRGERRVDIETFTRAYKQTALAADELIRDISLPRRFSG